MDDRNPGQAMTRYVYHASKGDPCLQCWRPASEHRPDSRNRAGDRHTQKGDRGRKRARKYRSDGQRMRYIGIDGEGIGRKDHRYVLLAAADENGRDEWYVAAKDPARDHLTTEECFDFILSLPTRHTKIFSYSFNYDITKMIQDMDNRSIYRLMRPDLPSRKRRGPAGQMLGPKPIEWTGPSGKAYKLNLQGTKFSVEDAESGKRVIVWDLFKFFQGKFVNALKDWKIGDDVLWSRMSAMKDKRSTFDKESFTSIITYCLEECRCMAQLATKLVEAHVSADLKLTSYYGAGSSGSAMLTAMGIKDKLAKTPPAMMVAVSSAFSGGRFENSVIGSVPEALYGWDISSAYVYQLAFLPCLQHGSWVHTTSRVEIEHAEAQNGALVRYELPGGSGTIRGAPAAWGPFPFRGAKGDISYPIESGGGWVWLDEFLAGERIYPNVRFREAWVYKRNCGCQPFGQIPEYYNIRLKIGKEGPGIVIKLGMNSCYGKLAQSVGNALFNSWIWAGMITSGCRAQILTMLGLHSDQANLLMIATDGIVTREKLTPPKPLPTKTDRLFPEKQKDGSIEMKSKPLGGWEAKDSPRGLFFARPGIYFPLNPTIEEIKEVRARGVGRSVVLESWRVIVDAWDQHGAAGVAKVANVSRFCGAKTSVSCAGERGADGSRYKRANGTGSEPRYGQWIKRPVEMSFDPLPKRERVNPDGRTLALRRFPGQVSAPYNRAVMRFAAETLAMKAAEQEALEQPDCDLIEYD